MKESDHFPTETQGLPQARRPELVPLTDGDQYNLRIAPVAKQVGDAGLRMLAYNGSIPGPTLRVQQGTELTVNVINEGDIETTVHWHGLRLENRYDGTPETQPAMPVGGAFTYRLKFPDPGLYWYHPHIREDYGQEMGLYGNIVVVPSDPDYWPSAHREITLTLDDILVEEGRVAPFHRSTVTYAAMGRFGNSLLVNGETAFSLTAQLGEVVRFYVTNTANTRVFNVGLPGARIKRVGGDSGHYEREEFVERFLIAPSERVIVDVLFDQPGPLTLEHHTPIRTYPLASIIVEEEPVERPLLSQFRNLRFNSDMVIERQHLARYLEANPDKTLALVAEMDMEPPEPQAGAVVVYFCPMDPEVTSNEPGRCPKCGMKLMPAQPAVEAPGEHPHKGEDEHAHESGGIEWEDDMAAINQKTTPANMHWKLIDRETGAEGHAIDWKFRVGDRVKIRLVNEMDSDHPMHHPFHIHGAGRFLILSRDGVVEPNLVWKDTVLIPAGQTVDILLEVTNPGLWMAHCHIAEHHESGMMFSFRVEPSSEESDDRSE